MRSIAAAGVPAAAGVCSAIGRFAEIALVLAISGLGACSQGVASTAPAGAGPAFGKGDKPAGSGGGGDSM